MPLGLEAGSGVIATEKNGYKAVSPSAKRITSVSCLCAAGARPPSGDQLAGSGIGPEHRPRDDGPSLLSLTACLADVVFDEAGFQTAKITPKDDTHRGAAGILAVPGLDQQVFTGKTVAYQALTIGRQGF